MEERVGHGAAGGFVQEQGSQAVLDETVHASARGLEGFAGGAGGLDAFHAQQDVKRFPRVLPEVVVEIRSLDEGACGDRSAELHRAVEPGEAEGAERLARPGDVVRWDDSVYTIEFDADGEGVPPTARTDAVSPTSGRSTCSNATRAVRVTGGR